MSISTGIGYDCHRFVSGRPLVIGGVTIPHERGLEGHSDADVLTHAIIDALLGAAGLGDIGQHFPDTDERYRGADSVQLLQVVTQMLAEHGRPIRHVDCTVVIEKPQIGPFREEIRQTLTRAMGLESSQVNVKATRGEGMGFVGRLEGASAFAIATLAT